MFISVVYLCCLSLSIGYPFLKMVLEYEKSLHRQMFNCLIVLFVLMQFKWPVSSSIMHNIFLLWQYIFWNSNYRIYKTKRFLLSSYWLGFVSFWRELLKVQGYRFPKGLTQNLNLRTNLKLEYNTKSLNYIQQNFRFQASFLFFWTMSFTFLTWSVV